MSIVDTFYQNFYTVCALIPVSFNLSLAIIFLTIPRKSKATIHLGMTFLFLTIFNAGYFFASMIYHPLAAYHRYLTLGFILFPFIHFTLFFFYYPDEIHKRVPWIIGPVLYIISITLTVIFIVITQKSSIVFHFDGHYWDFDADEFSRFFGIIILAYLAVFFITGIWRTIITKTVERWAVLSITLVMFLIILIPGLTNTLSREGVVGRDVYQITQDLFVILGFFIVAIIYINTTRDRTNFITKIIAITLATILLVFQGLSYFSLQDLEKSYDARRNRDLILALKTDTMPEGLSYILSYSMNDNTFMTEKPGVSGIPNPDIEQQMRNTYFYESLRSSDKETYYTVFAGDPDETGLYFEGYRKTITDIINSVPANHPKPVKYVLNEIRKLEQPIRYARKKIKQIPEEKFRQDLKNFLPEMSPDLRHFKKVISDYPGYSSLAGRELKNAVLPFLALMKPEKSRVYRTGSDNTHFISYMKADLEKKEIHETGFSYISYREYIHPTSLKLIIMLGIIMALIFIGFRIFFIGAFVRPLRSILDAMDRIRSGDTKVEIPVRVEDEIGIITRNFNRMTYTIRTASKGLDYYAEHLEEMVEERTKELTKTNQELEAAMAIMEAMNEDLFKTNKELKEAQRIASLDIQMAVNVQSSFFPKTAPRTKDWDIAYVFIPMAGVSGDMYDFYIRDGELDGISLFDVSGHGIASGLITMIAKSIIFRNFYENYQLKLNRIIERVNDEITKEIGNVDNYLTGCILRFRENVIEYVNAGHTDPVYMNSRTGSTKIVYVKEKTVKGMFLGIEDMKDRFTVINFFMEQGDYLLLYSDCLIETKNNENEEYGIENVMSSMKETRGKPAKTVLEKIIRELYKFSGTNKLQDDLTAILLRRLT